MGDGVQKRYAVIINGDTGDHHLANVDRAIKALRKEGPYEITLVSPTRSEENVEFTHHQTPKISRRFSMD